MPSKPSEEHLLGIGYSYLPKGEREFEEGSEKVDQAAKKVDKSSRKASKGLGWLRKSLASAVDPANLAKAALLGVGTAAAALGAFSVAAVLQVSSFEAGLVGVGKTADISGSALTRMGEGIDQLSLKLTDPAERLLEIGQAAGQLGVKGEENILTFVEVISKLGAASDLAGEAAATSLARILNVTGESVDRVENLASVLVVLGNNFAATEAQIARHTGEVARATAVYEIGSAQAAAIATTLAAFGVQAELSGSTIGRTFRTIESAVRAGGQELSTLAGVARASSDELVDAWASGPVEAFNLLLSGMQKTAASGGDLNGQLESIGLSGQEVLKVLPVLAKELETLTRAQALASAEDLLPTALEEEFARSLESLQSQFALLKNQAASFSRAVGAELLPVVKDIVSVVMEWLDANRGLATELGSRLAASLRLVTSLSLKMVKAGSVLVEVLWSLKEAALAFGVTLGAIKLGLLIQAFIALGSYKATLVVMTAAIKLATLAQVGFNTALATTTAFLAGPGGIALLVAAGVGFWANWARSNERAREAADEMNAALGRQNPLILQQNSALKDGIAVALERAVADRELLAARLAAEEQALRQVTPGSFRGLEVDEILSGIDRLVQEGIITLDSELAKLPGRFRATQKAIRSNADEIKSLQEEQSTAAGITAAFADEIARLGDELESPPDVAGFAEDAASALRDLKDEISTLEDVRSVMLSTGLAAEEASRLVNILLSEDRSDLTEKQVFSLLNQLRELRSEVEAIAALNDRITRLRAEVGAGELNRSNGPDEIPFEITVPPLDLPDGYLDEAEDDWQRMIDADADAWAAMADGMVLSAADAFDQVIGDGEEMWRSLARIALDIFTDLMRRQIAQHATAQATMRAGSAGSSIVSGGSTSTGGGSGGDQAGTAAAFGASAGAGLAVLFFTEAIKDYKLKQARRAQATFNGSTRISGEGGRLSSSFDFDAGLNTTADNASKIAAGLLEVIGAMESATGVFVDSLPEIAIAVSQSGDRFRAEVGGELVGYFSNINEAIQAAASEAFARSALLGGLDGELSENLKRVFSYRDATEQTLGIARELDGFKPSNQTQAWADFRKEFRAVGDVVDAAGLSVADYVAWKNREIQVLKESAREGLRGVAGIASFGSSIDDAVRAAEEFNLQRAAEIRAGEREISVRRASLGALGEAVDAQVNFSDSVLKAARELQNFDDGLITFEQLKTALASTGVSLQEATEALAALGDDGIGPVKAVSDRAVRELKELEDGLRGIPDAISESDINLAVEGAFGSLLSDLLDLTSSEKGRQELARITARIEIESLRVRAAELLALNRLTRAQVDLLNGLLIDAEGVLSSGGGRRRGGGSSRRQERETLNEELTRIERSSLPSATAALLDLGDRFDEISRQAERLGVSQERVNRAREIELELLRERGVRDGLREFLAPERIEGGTFGLSDFDRQAAEIRARFEEIREVNEALLISEGELAEKRWQVNQAERNALRLLAEAVIDSFGLPMRQARAQVRGMREALEFLNKQFQEGIIGAGKVADFVAQLGARVEGELFGIAAGILETMGATQQAAQLRKLMEEANFDLQVAQLNFLFVQYQALGLLSEEAAARIADALAFINDPANRPDFTVPELEDTGGGGGGFGGGQLALGPSDDDRRREEILRQIDEWNRLAQPETFRRLADLAVTFDEMIADAQRLGISVSDARAAYGVAVDEFWDQILGPFEEERADTVAARLGQINDQFDEMVEAAREWGGDLARIEAARQSEIARFWDNALAPLRDLEDELDRLAGSTPEDRLRASEGRFNDAIQAALSGDLDAISSLPALMRDYLGEAGSFFSGSEDAYQAIVQAVRASIAAVSALGGMPLPGDGGVLDPNLPGGGDVEPVKPPPLTPGGSFDGDQGGGATAPSGEAGGGRLEDLTRLVDTLARDNVALTQKIDRLIVILTRQVRAGEKSNRQRTGVA